MYLAKVNYGLANQLRRDTITQDSAFALYSSCKMGSTMYYMVKLLGAKHKRAENFKNVLGLTLDEVIQFREELKSEEMRDLRKTLRGFDMIRYIKTAYGAVARGMFYAPISILTNLPLALDVQILHGAKEIEREWHRKKDGGNRYPISII